MDDVGIPVVAASVKESGDGGELLTAMVTTAICYVQRRGFARDLVMAAWFAGCGSSGGRDRGGDFASVPTRKGDAIASVVDMVATVVGLLFFRPVAVAIVADRDPSSPQMRWPR